MAIRVAGDRRYARRPVEFVDVADRSRLAGIAARPGRLLLVAPRALVAALPEVDASGGYVLLASPLAEPPVRRHPARPSRGSMSAPAAGPARRGPTLPSAVLVGLGLLLYLPALGVEVLRHPP